MIVVKIFVLIKELKLEKIKKTTIINKKIFEDNA